MCIERAACLVIDDSVHGIAAACAAGMKSIGFVDPADPRRNRKTILSAAGASFVAEGADELEAILADIIDVVELG